MSNQIVQYVLLRSDLLKDLGWSIGALVAQACHASTAVLHLYKEDENTVKYLNDLDNMHKVVLEVPNEDSLKKVAEKLKENSIDHKLWIEQPENIPTCLALKPYPKDQVKKYVEWTPRFQSKRKKGRQKKRLSDDINLRAHYGKEQQNLEAWKKLEEAFVSQDTLTTVGS